MTASMRLPPTPNPRVIEIQKIVCDWAGITVQEMLHGGRFRRVVVPKQMAICIAREITGHSLPALGRMFGGLDHTSCLWAERKWRRGQEQNEATRQTFEMLRARVADLIEARMTTHKILVAAAELDAANEASMCDDAQLPVMSFGVPTGASGITSALLSCFAAICTRRSISRTESR